ncbi:MAG TPA: hypothetical protein ENI23_08175 [bacterium]|nr:hypothetical protein [bacterium]
MVKKTRKRIGGGLRPLVPDSRDFKLERLGGFFLEPKMPTKSFLVAEPKYIRDQGSDDSCTSRAISTSLEKSEGVRISEEFQFAKTKQLEGSIEQWGADPRLAVKVPVKVGALEKKFSPYTFSKDGRDFVSDWRNYDSVLDVNARFHKQKSFFRADDRPGTKDYFDSIILSLWQNREFKRTAPFGIDWYGRWNFSTTGVIEKVPENESKIGHMVEALGLEVSPISKKLHLVVQNSSGTGWGDNGVGYFSREAINTGARYGAFQFIDLTDEQLARILYPCFVKRLWKDIFN